jgi:hypothetical protein
VPVLARIVEAAGIPTVVATMMPEIAERFRLPRLVGVEFPFGHPFGMPHDSTMQRAVALAALSLYERTDLPARTDVPIVWPVDWKSSLQRMAAKRGSAHSHIFEEPGSFETR